MSQGDYDKYSDGLNYSYLLAGGGSFVLFLVAQINNIPILSFLSVTTFVASIYFLPHFNEIRKNAKLNKVTEKDKKMLIIRGIGIVLIGILNFCYFVLSYKFYEKNEKFIIAFYSIMVILMLTDSSMKVPKKFKDLKSQAQFKSKLLITILLLAVQFFVFLYPIYDYIGVNSKYSSPVVKLPKNIMLREINLTKSNKFAITINNDNFQNDVSNIISNKSSSNISFLKGFRLNLEQQSQKYYEINSYNNKSGIKEDKTGTYANSLIIFKNRPIIIADLQSYAEAANGKPKYTNSKSVIELSDEEYKTLQNCIVSSEKK